MLSDGTAVGDRDELKRCNTEQFWPTSPGAFDTRVWTPASNRVLQGAYKLWAVFKANSGLDTMIDLNQKDNLARLYRLFIMVPAGRTTLRRALKDSILRRGIEINRAYGDENSPDNVAIIPDDPKGKGKARAPAAPVDIASKWVEDVLSLKDKFDQYWRHCFESDREFETSCNEVRASVIDWMITYCTSGVRDLHKP